MGAPELRVLNDSKELAGEAAELFVWLGKQVIEQGGRFRVALSGGSTPRALYETLASRPFSERLDWKRVEFYFGDERCVPPDHPESNFRTAEEALFGPLRIAPERIFRMKGEADPDEAVRQYEALIRERFGAAPPAWPSFDLILLGLGEDAHTASLFPGTAALNEKTRLVVVNQSPKGVKNRLTLTAAAINQAQTVVFLVSGAGKAGAVCSVLEEDDGQRGQGVARFPARSIRPVKGRLIWLLDGAAAAGLTIAKQGIASHEE
ncbi:MAG: 6-phosphogluconolactonase [Nitrospirae bacterium]|nr:6-phosphogluconolactonase [Nitrospirota bacterium]